MMRKYVTATAALTMLLFLFAAPSLMGGEEGPSIVIEEMRKDLGQVFEQKSYKHTFKVKNVGNAELRIQEVKPG